MSSRSSAPAALLVCTGKSCRRKDGWRDLLDLERGRTDGHTIRCQDICKGPVAGVVVDGEVRWFARLRTPKRRAQLLRALDEGRVPKGLREREVGKRRGRIRD